MRAIRPSHAVEAEAEAEAEGEGGGGRRRKRRVAGVVAGGCRASPRPA